MRFDLIVLTLFFSLMISPAFAQEAITEPEMRTEKDDKGIFNVVLENDLFAGRDGGYTNGIRFAWSSPEKNVPQFARWTANRIMPWAKEGNKRISLAAGQSMFAPNDLSRRDLITDDRPYAGYLYGSVGVVSDTGKTLDNAVLTLGVVGPSALAEPTQKIVHRIVDSPDPKGWDNQLKDEPAINLSYERKWRSLYQAEPFGIGTDIIPHVGVNLGNVNTSAVVGATMRVGYDLPADYGPPRIRPSLPGSDFFVPTQKLGGYLFTSVEQRAVGHDIFLDGNSFRDDTPHVDRNILVSALQVGAAVTYGDARLSYTHVLMTKQFDGEKKAPQFGAVTLSYRF